MGTDDAYWFTTNYTEARWLAAWAGIPDDYVVERTVAGRQVYAIADRETCVLLNEAQVAALRPGVWSSPGRELLAGGVPLVNCPVLRVRAVDDETVRVAVAYDDVADPDADMYLNAEQVRALHEWLCAWLRAHGEETEDA